VEPNHSNPEGLAQYHGSGSSQFLKKLGKRESPSTSTVEGGLTVIDWAGAVIAPANTIGAATAQMTNAFILCLSSRPLVECQGRTAGGIRPSNVRQTGLVGQLRASGALASTRLPRRRRDDTGGQCGAGGCGGRAAGLGGAAGAGRGGDSEFL
jgi:hypothetical protein